MTAEEFDKTLKEPIKGRYIIDFDYKDAYAFAEAYAKQNHLSKLNEITEKDIEEAYENGVMKHWCPETVLGYVKGFENCAKWLLNKLKNNAK